MNALRMVISATISTVSDLASDYRCRDFVRMSIGDALTNIIPVFIRGEAAAGRGVYFGGSDFYLQITFNGIAGGSDSLAIARLLIPCLLQDFNFHNCLKSDHKLSESGGRLPPWI